MYGITRGSTVGVVKRDTRSLDNGLYGDNGKENGNYYCLLVAEEHN